MLNQFWNQIVTVTQHFIDTPYFKIFYFFLSIFLILLMIGIIRKRYFHLRMEGANVGFIVGVITVLLVETIAVVAVLYGYTTIDIIKGKKSRHEIIRLTQEGVQRVNQVLGVQLCSQATPSATFLLEQLPKLSKQEEEKVKQVLCK